jgi:hypothetical protein
MALSLIFQGILVEKAGFDGGSYGVVRRKPLLFKRIDTVGQFISETPERVSKIAEYETIKHEFDNKRELQHFWKGIYDTFV